MKSQQHKRQLEIEGRKREEVRQARENNPHLMALYLAFLPSYNRHMSRWVDDKYGNRILRSSVVELPLKELVK